MRRTSLAVFAVPVAVLLMQGCASTATTDDAAAKPAVVPAAAAPAAAPAPVAVAAPVAPAAAPVEAPKITASLYEVYQDGRVYRFYDWKDYQSFLKVGEAPFRLTQIGTGPHGETVVYGLAKADKEKTSGIPSIELLAGNIKPDIFYGEMIRDGRIFVFSKPADMQPVREHGEAVFRYSDIGAGPNGETVVYVLNKDNKEKLPTELMSQFKAKRSS